MCGVSGARDFMKRLTNQLRPFAVVTVGSEKNCSIFEEIFGSSIKGVRDTTATSSPSKVRGAKARQFVVIN